MLMGRTSKKQIDEVQKCTSSICLPLLFYCLLLVIFVIPFVVVPIFGCIHPKITHEASEQKGNNQHKEWSRTKPVYPHSHHFSFYSPAVQSPTTRFLGVFRHFQGSPRLSVPFCCCVLYAFRIGFHALQFLIYQFYCKLRVHFWGGVFPAWSVLSLLRGGNLLFRT